MILCNYDYYMKISKIESKLKMSSKYFAELETTGALIYFS